MSKKPQFWEKFKKNYHAREAVNHKVTHNRVNSNNKDVKHSCSDSSLPFQNSCLQTTEQSKSKHDYVSNSCDNDTRKGCSTSRADNSSLGKTKLSLEYIDSLVDKIKELKTSVKYIEHRCDCGARQRENVQIGDYDALTFRKWHKNQNRGDTSNFPWLESYEPPFQNNCTKSVDHQKSIYTTNGHIFQDPSSKISKNQKNKSNASLIMSLHSMSKNNFIKVNPHPDSKNFQAAAEEFIEQAEELKAKIGYILECCGYNNIPGVSEPSESIYPSDCNHSTTNKDYGDDVISDRDMRFLFGAVSSQYSEILTSLMTIKKQIKSLNKHRTSKPLSKISSRDSIRYNNNKISTFDRSPPPTATAIKNIVSENANKLSRTLTKKQHSREVPISLLKGRKDSHIDKNLEPVVMVYEPILPECDLSPLMGVCKYCGQELNSCTGCNEESKVKLKKGTCRNKKEDETTEKYGFVVTYTPDISMDVNSTPSTSKESTKAKKKIIPCLWF